MKIYFYDKKVERDFSELIEVKSSLCKLGFGFYIKNKINNENERPSLVIRERLKGVSY